MDKSTIQLHSTWLQYLKSEFQKNYMIDLKEKLLNGDTTIGTWLSIPSEINTEIISLAGLDFVIIDQEHGPVGFETAQKMAISAELHSTSPILRLGDINKAFFQNALDIGIHGIQIPNVETKEDAERIIKYSLSNNFLYKKKKEIKPINKKVEL